MGSTFRPVSLVALRRLSGRNACRLRHLTFALDRAIVKSLPTAVRRTLGSSTEGEPMSDPTQIPSFGSVESSSTTPAAEKTEKKSTVTKRDVTELLASFAPEAPKVESPAEKERNRRVTRLEQAVRVLAGNLEEWGVTEGNPVDAAAALKALKTVQVKATSAILGLTEAKLGLVEPKPRQPRAAVKEEAPTETVLPLEAGDSDGDDADQQDDAFAGEETPEQIDARLAAQRAERGAPTRSGPPAPAVVDDGTGF